MFEFLISGTDNAMSESTHRALRFPASVPCVFAIFLFMFHTLFGIANTTYIYIVRPALHAAIFIYILFVCRMDSIRGNWGWIEGGDG